MIVKFDYRGEQIPCRVSYYALKKFKEDTGKEFSKIDTEKEPELIEVLLYYALKSGYNASDMEFSFKKEDMELVLDEIYFDFIAAIPKFFQSITDKVQQDEIDNQEKLAKTKGGRSVKKKQ